MSAPPTNIVRQGLPSRSALRVATLRAVHALLDEPRVLVDDLALPLLGATTADALRDDPFALNDPLSRGLRAALVVRSRFFEDELARGVAAGVRQCVVLGAGLDTLAYRHPHAHQGLTVFEVDHPATQGWKQRLLDEAGIARPATLRFVPADFECDDVAAALKRAGFQPDQPACVSWMGVTLYLTRAAVHQTLALVAGFAPGSSLCFDYRLPDAQLNPIERLLNQVIEQQMAAQGEPWLSSFDPVELRQTLIALGFSSAETATPDLLNARYFARRKDGLRTGGGACIMRALK